MNRHTILVRVEFDSPQSVNHMSYLQERLTQNARQEIGDNFVAGSIKNPSVDVDHWVSDKTG